MIPLFSVEQVRNADSFAINSLKIPGQILMENAAISIIDAILTKYPYLDSSYRFGIVCGKGNNGGDGFALARHLIIRGFRVEILSLAKEKELIGDALSNFLILSKIIKNYPESRLSFFNSMRDCKKITDCEIIVDALLGTGSSGSLKAPYDQIISKLNTAQSIKIAVDSPTGLNLETGSGEIIFEAHLTVTLAALKTGLFYEEGRSNCGHIEKGSIGMGETYFDSLQTSDFLIEPEDIVNYLPKKRKNIHKYTAGKVLTIAGSSDLPGAAIFTMNAAMISGAGAGILAFPQSLIKLAQSQMNSAVVVKYEDNENGYFEPGNIKDIQDKIDWADAIAIGPGLGRNESTSKAVFELLLNNSQKNFVIDADAIFAINDKKYKKLNLEDKVLTPHHKEFADMIGKDLDEVKMNLISYGRKFSQETGSILVLKGAPTITFNPQGEMFINSSGNSGLAKFGSGDVLSGIIASFLAQNDEIESSAVAAVYIHGLTADLIKNNESEFGITPDKLIEHFSSTVKFLRKSIV